MHRQTVQFALEIAHAGHVDRFDPMIGQQLLIGIQRLLDQVRWVGVENGDKHQIVSEDRVGVRAPRLAVSCRNVETVDLQRFSAGADAPQSFDISIQDPSVHRIG